MFHDKLTCLIVFFFIIKELKRKYPNRLDYKISNFFSMWKSDFLDRLDSGERIDKMFEGILIKPWGKGTNN